MEILVYRVTFNPPGDGDCFYSSAAQALGLATQSLKTVRREYLNFNLTLEG